MPSRLKLPRVEPPNRIEFEYKRQLLRMVRFMEQQIKEKMVPLLRTLAEEGAAELPPGGRADAIRTDDRQTIDRVFIEIEEVVDQRFPPSWIEGAASDAASQVNQHNIKKNETTFRRLIGIKPILAEPWLDRRAEAFVSDNVDLIKSMRREYLTKVKGHVTRAVDRGTLNRDFAQEIERNFGRELSKATGNVRARARLIARDQIAKFNGQINQARQQSLGFKKYRWETSGDERVRPSHEANNGKVFSWDDPPATGHPGEDFQCLVGTTKINGLPNVEIAYRRWYTGELTTIVSESGESLSCTPNHPILTTQGLVHAQNLKPGHEIIELRNQSLDKVKGNADYVKPSIGDIFGALAISGCTSTRGVSTQFHGDGTDNEVNVVIPIDSLPFKMNPSRAKKISKLSLTFANVVLGRRGLSRWCDSSFVVSGLLRVSRGFVRVSSLSGSLFGSHLRPFQKLCLGASSWFDAVQLKILVDDSGDAEFFGNGVDAFSEFESTDQDACIQNVRRNRGKSLSVPSVYPSSPDVLAKCYRAASQLSSKSAKTGAAGYRTSKILEIKTRNFSGHVYNLQTKSGYYVANNIVVGNCRCYAAPVITPEYDGPINIKGAFR